MIELSFFFIRKQCTLVWEQGCVSCILSPRRNTSSQQCWERLLQRFYVLSELSPNKNRNLPAQMYDFTLNRDFFA